MKARIKKNAPSIFMREHRKLYKNTPLPKTYQSFYELLKQLKGKELEVDYVYPDKNANRIVLKYPVPIIKNGKKIVGIGLDINLVETSGLMVRYEKTKFDKK